MFSNFRVLIVAGLCVLSLSGCKSVEERAQEHFDKGVALIEGGDVAKGLVELRNVFDLEGDHLEARHLYAATVRKQGKLGEAYSQYLRLVEQYPNDLEGRVALSEISFRTRNFDEFLRHGQAAVELAPEDPRVKALGLAITFLERVKEDPRSDTSDMTADITAAALEQPDNLILRRLAVDVLVRDEKLGSALEAVDRAIEKEPKNFEFHDMKLAILSQLQDNDGIEKQLISMVDMFPDRDELKGTLVSFLRSQNQPDRAEEFLRSFADPTVEPPSYFLALVNFLNQTKGADAALAELDTAIEANPEVGVLKAMRAELRYGLGQTDGAIAELEQLVASMEPSDQQRRFKAALAQMLQQTGNEIGARKLVEEILAEDGSQVEALRMRAQWQIKSDDTDGAISSLRTALDSDPNDAAALTLMSEAHARAGNAQLAQDFLGLAVEASGQSPAESVRYAKVLIKEESYLAAEDVLMAALRRAPTSVSLMSQLGKLYILKNDEARLKQLIETLRGMEDETAEALANQLQAAQIERSEGRVASSRFLEEMAAGSGNELASTAAVVRTRLLEGKPDAALAHIQNAYNADPDNLALRHMLGITRMAVGEFDNAEGDFRALTEALPKQPQFWLDLVRALHAQGEFEAADAEIDRGLEENPDHPNLLWAKASFLQREGDIEGAIAIYRGVYEEHSDSYVIANNLASLLADYSDDPEALEKAWNVARRLRGIEVPAFQDTYGWIAYRRGDLDEALDHLRPAALGLPDDVFVQYHLARALMDKGLDQEALDQFEQVKRVIDVDPGRIDVAEVDAAIAKIEAKLSESQ